MRLAMETGFVSVMATSYSEIVLQPKLDDPGVAGGLRVVGPSGSDLSERAAETGAIGLDKLKLGVIPSVEELRPELDRLALGDLRRLGKGQVPIVDPRAEEGVPSERPKTEYWNASGRRRALNRAHQIGRVNPEVACGCAWQATTMHSVRAGSKRAIRPRVVEDLYRPDLVRAIKTTALLAGIVRRKQREWIPGLESHDSVPLPALGELVEKTVALERAIQRYLPDPAKHQALGGVKICQGPVLCIVKGVGVR